MDTVRYKLPASDECYSTFDIEETPYDEDIGTDSENNSFRGRVCKFVNTTPGRFIVWAGVLLGAGLVVAGFTALPLFLTGRGIASVQVNSTVGNVSANNLSFSLPTFVPTRQYSFVPTLQQEKTTAEPYHDETTTGPYHRGSIDESKIQQLADNLVSKVNETNLRAELRSLLKFGTRCHSCFTFGKGTHHTPGYLSALQSIKSKITDMNLSTYQDNIRYLVGTSVKNNCQAEHEMSCNLFTMIPGRSNDSVVVVGAHLDTAYKSVGANDNGSGVVSLLEMIRIFNDSDIELKNSIVFSFWGEEETGTRSMIGSRTFVGMLPGINYKSIIEELAQDNKYVSTFRNVKIKSYINLDIVGSKNNGAPIGYGVDDPEATSSLRMFRHRPLLNAANGSEAVTKLLLEFFDSRNISVIKSKPRQTSDQASFHDKSIPASFLFTLSDTNWHTEKDDYNNVDFGKLKKCTQATVYALTKLSLGDELS